VYASAAADKPKHGRFVQSVAYSPDGRRVACGAMDGTVAVFDSGSGKLLHTLEGHAMPVRSLTFGVDGKTLFTACDDGHIHMYDVEHRSLMEALPGHKSWVLVGNVTPPFPLCSGPELDLWVPRWRWGDELRGCVSLCMTPIGQPCIVNQRRVTLFRLRPIGVVVCGAHSTRRGWPRRPTAARW
jgi:WD40 repeat protein